MTTYEKVKEWRIKNKDKVNEQARRYRKKHPETNKKAKVKYRNKDIGMTQKREAAYSRKWRKENPTKQNERYEKWRIKREIKLWEIAGRERSLFCELCLKDEITVFDHCHSTGFFRGWICDRCNKVLGLAQDSIFLVSKMIQYLENFNGKVDIKEAQLTSKK